MHLQDKILRWSRRNGQVRNDLSGADTGGFNFLDEELPISVPKRDKSTGGKILSADCHGKTADYWNKTNIGDLWLRDSPKRIKLN